MVKAGLTMDGVRSAALRQRIADSLPPLEPEWAGDSGRGYVAKFIYYPDADARRRWYISGMGWHGDLGDAVRAFCAHPEVFGGHGRFHGVCAWEEPDGRVDGVTLVIEVSEASPPTTLDSFLRF